MGGHGGLNILPQKRWHLYRDDNRSRVARDEREHRESIRKIRKGGEQKAFQDRIAILSGRSDEATNRFSLNGAAESQHRDATMERKKHGDERSIEYTSSSQTPPLQKQQEHINFFADEEEQHLKRQHLHERYLKGVGHSVHSISDFDICAQQSPWYAQPKPVNERIEKLEKCSGVTPSKEAFYMPTTAPTVPSSTNSNSVIKSAEHKRRRHKQSKRERASDKEATIKQLRKEREMREKDESKRSTAFLKHFAK